jgi:hypothetical protein
MARGTATALAVILAAAALSACNSGSSRAILHSHQSFDVAIGAHTELGVTTFDGHINVTAIGEGTIDVSVTAFGSGATQDAAKSAVDTVDVAITRAGEGLTVLATAKSDAPFGTRRGADVDVVLPPNSSLTLVTSNARIEAINVHGSVLATTSNAEIVARGGRDLHLQTSNGAVTMSEPAGTIQAITSNAAVDILNADRVLASLDTSNGTIAFSGSLAPGDHVFRTTNAALSLRLPGDQGFTVSATASNASVTSDFAGISASGASLAGTAGDGSANITAETSNGSISIARLKP